jgi:hypothetical protein
LILQWRRLRQLFRERDLRGGLAFYLKNYRKGRRRRDCDSSSSNEKNSRSPMKTQ